MIIENYIILCSNIVLISRARIIEKYIKNNLFHRIVYVSDWLVKGQQVATLIRVLPSTHIAQFKAQNHKKLFIQSILDTITLFTSNQKNKILDHYYTSPLQYFFTSKNLSYNIFQKKSTFPLIRSKKTQKMFCRITFSFFSLHHTIKK